MISFDMEKIRELLGHFYNLTGIKICIYDRSGNEIAYYPQQHMPFCEYVSSCKPGNELCKKSAQNAIERCAREHKRLIYTCEMGLTECVAPIMSRDGIVGFVMLGQVSTEDGVPTHLPTELGLDEKKLKQLKSTIRTVPRNVLESAAAIMESCASYICQKNMYSLADDDLQRKIGEYIDSHLCDRLTVGSLCDTFLVSKTALYGIFSEYYGTTVLEYITTKRIELARELLRNSTKNIMEIAEKTGFSDYNYFIKVFKKETGQSPFKYRKSGQNNA